MPHAYSRSAGVKPLVAGWRKAPALRSGTDLALVLAGVLLMSIGGCPIDSDVVVTETTRAALQAAVDSLVESLSQYLAGN